jgi:hypothetical protein
MPSRYYRPRIKNNGAINWHRLLGLIAILRETSKTSIITEAIASYCESRLDETLHAKPSIFSKDEIERELKKIRTFLERGT